MPLHLLAHARAKISADWPGFAAASTDKFQDDTSHVRLGCSNPWKVQDLGLGVGLLWKLWILLCWAAVPAVGGLGAD